MLPLIVLPLKTPAKTGPVAAWDKPRSSLGQLAVFCSITEKSLLCPHLSLGPVGFVSGAIVPARGVRKLSMCLVLLVFLPNPVLGGAALFAFQHQQCIKIRVLRAQDVDTPLSLNGKKGQHLPALEVHKNQSPSFDKVFCRRLCKVLR